MAASSPSQLYPCPAGELCARASSKSTTVRIAKRSSSPQATPGNERVDPIHVVTDDPRAMRAELPFVIEPDSPPVEPASWLEQQADRCREALRDHGAVLLRGVVAPSEDSLELACRHLLGPAEPYLFRSTPRVEVRRYIYTATEYPHDLSIPQHSENSFARA